METKERVLYTHMENEQILTDMTTLMETEDTSAAPEPGQRARLYDVANRLLEFCVHCGFEGNLWQDYLTSLLINHENAYSEACEITGAVKGSINEMALADCAIFQDLFSYDLAALFRKMDAQELTVLLDYQGADSYGDVYSRRTRDCILALSRDLSGAKDAAEFKEILTKFYGQFGVGKFGLHKAFRLEHDGADVQIVPIHNIPSVSLDDLVGYDLAKKKLIDNTEAFVHGRKANNCLLFGDAGTGKSTSVKAILNQYYDQGLRMIEVYKHQFQDLNDVIAQVKNRNYKFILFMDDLSFEEFETEYKYLKAVIEGGLEKSPENVLIYATSNRRHLIRESSHDRDDQRSDMHTSDTVQEKLSLSARFGVTIYFGRPDKKEFQEIVRVLADRNDIQMSEEELLVKANQWEISHGGFSGRTAQQFIDDLAGKMPD